MNLLIVLAVIGILVLAIAFLGIEITIYLVYEAINETIRYLRKKKLTGLIAVLIYFPFLQKIGFLKMKTTNVVDGNIYHILLFIVCLCIIGLVLGFLLNLLILQKEKYRKMILLAMFSLCTFIFIPMINKYTTLLTNIYYPGITTVTFILTVSSVISAIVYLLRLREYVQTIND